MLTILLYGLASIGALSIVLFLLVIWSALVVGSRQDEELDGLLQGGYIRRAARERE
jgi:hypothetical protein